MIYQKAHLARKKIINDAYFNLDISLSTPLASVNAGQFVMFKNLEDNSTFLPRPFSIYSIEKNNDGTIISIGLLIKGVGKGTMNLKEIKEGTPVSLLGPLGNGFTVPDDQQLTIAVAGGIGIAPFLMLGRQLRGTGRSFSVLYGGKSLQDKNILREFEEEGFEIRTASEDGSFGEKGLVTALLFERMESMADKQSCLILACGPEPMLRAVAFEAVRQRIDCQLSLESRMACGIGTCHGCVIPVRDNDGTLTYERVCKEGPVFDAKKFYFDG